MEIITIQKELPPVGAKFSECRQYRYVLWRIFDSSRPCVAYIGLNPSKADEGRNDNTIKKLVKITKNNGYGGFYMLNLFGIISTEPGILLYHHNPLGMNDEYLKATIEMVDKVVCCWGSFEEAYKKGRAQEVTAMVPEEKRYCIRLSSKGRPWHPLYCYDVEQFIKF